MNTCPHRNEDIVICDGSNELSDPSEVAKAFFFFLIDKIEKNQGIY